MECLGIQICKAYPSALNFMHLKRRSCSEFQAHLVLQTEYTDGLMLVVAVYISKRVVLPRAYQQDTYTLYCM